VINMRNENSKCYKSSIVIITLRFCSCILCLTVMPFDLLMFVKGSAYAGSDELVEYQLEQDNLTDSDDSSEQLKRQLWKADITPVRDVNESNKSVELQQLIRKIRAIDFQSQQEPPQKVVPPKIAPADESNGPDDNSDVSTESVTIPKKEPEPNLPYTPISGETLKLLGSLSQNPRQIDNPLELGELLFRNGNYKQAVLFYREALNRADPNSSRSSMNRAWILFQIGNCLRSNDMDEAERIYSQLITEFPNSLWADMAVVQTQYIAWYKKDEPQKLISQNKPKNIGVN
jgi:tetratricopeptide (TPR) repeat protein